VLEKKPEICTMAIFSTKSEGLESHLVSLFVPERILRHFIIDQIIENEREILFSLTEKEDQVPKELTDKQVVLDGFMNSSIIQSFPTKGKQCYIGLKRRRWKEKGGTKAYHNHYKFTSKGTMATKEFGAFLKRNSLIGTPCSIVL